SCLPLSSHSILSTLIYALSLHDALPIFLLGFLLGGAVTPPEITAIDEDHRTELLAVVRAGVDDLVLRHAKPGRRGELLKTGLPRSEEHTSELQSRENLVCRLLLEKKKPT